jgi:hypothetical protein
MDSHESQPMDKEAQARRADVLLAWQTTCDSRINKLLIMILIVTLFYLYYGLISPQLTKARFERINLAKADLEPIIDQFQTLRNRYIYLVNPPANALAIAASDMGVFTDKIIPAIRKQKLTDVEISLVARLNNDMETLSNLHKAHVNSHPANSAAFGDYSAEQLRLQLREFRRALGTIVAIGPGVEPDALQQENTRRSNEAEDVRDLQAALDLQRLLSGGKTHFDVRNDPVNDLNRLRELETVIRDLRALANDANSEDRGLADKARDGLESDPSGRRDIQMGDTITRTFPAYQGLSEYTELNAALKYSHGTDIGSYAQIRDLLNPPFEVSSIADLRKLKQFADSETDRISAEQRAPMLSIPFINASIDRDVVLAITPLFVVLLLHLLAGNVDRSLGLTKALDEDETNSVARKDYSELAPYHLVTFARRQPRPEQDRRSMRGILSWVARSLRTLVDLLLAKALPFLVPLLFGITFLVDLFSSQRASIMAPFSVLSIMFLVSTVLMVAESATIYSLLHSEHKEP